MLDALRDNPTQSVINTPVRVIEDQEGVTIAAPELPPSHSLSIMNAIRRISHSSQLYAAGKESEANAELMSIQADVVESISRYFGTDASNLLKRLAFGNQGSSVSLDDPEIDKLMSFVRSDPCVNNPGSSNCTSIWRAK